VGDDTRLICSTDGDIPVIWNKYPHAYKKIVLYRLGQIHEDFRRRIKVSPAVRGQYNLIINNVQLSDQGIYECRDRAGLGESVKAYLSVRPEITSQHTPGNNIYLIIPRYPYKNVKQPSDTDTFGTY